MAPRARPTSAELEFATRPTRTRPFGPARKPPAARPGVRRPAPAGIHPTRRRRREQPCSHPRECGDPSDHAIRRILAAGSSPRMRGSIHVCGDGPRTTLVIPAHAGIHRRDACSGPTCPSHPRERGDPSLGPAVPPQLQRPSPRTRDPPPHHRAEFHPRPCRKRPRSVALHRVSLRNRRPTVIRQSNPGRSKQAHEAERKTLDTAGPRGMLRVTLDEHAASSDEVTRHIHRAKGLQVVELPSLPKTCRVPRGVLRVGVTRQIDVES